MFFSKVKVKRLGIWGGITDIATLEFNVKDEVVPESFLDQNKYKSQNLERIIKRIKNIKPKNNLKVQLKRLGQKPKTIDSLDDLIEYYLDNIIVNKSPIPTHESSLTFLPLKDASDENGLNIRSKYQVNLSPIKASKVKPCSLLRSLLSRPSKPVHAICYNSYGAGSQSRPLPLGSNIHSVASNSEQYL